MQEASAHATKLQTLDSGLRMAKLAKQNLILSFFILLVIIHWNPANSHEIGDEHDFDYNNKSGNGPARWGEIHSEWSLCNNGIMQSPIDLINERVQIVSHLGKLKRSYKPSNAVIMNRGHDMMLRWEGDAGHIVINGTKYELRQCHWHSPAEHTINGRRHDLEAHLVHESPHGNIAVIGILYKIGRPDTFLSSIKDHLEITDDPNEEQDAGVISPKNINIGSRKYYRYIGSLTVPPCTENVVWTIVGKVRTVSRDQVRLLRVAVHDDSGSNARPLQQLNKRFVELYRPDD